MKWPVLALCLLAACSPVPPIPDVPIPLRNPTAPVASQANVTVARLQGDWRIVEAAGHAPGTRVTISAFEMKIGEDVFALIDEGRGRLLVGASSLWVHWLDFDDRTVALGDPAGSQVWVMDRTGKPGERLAAARKILDWYGYDLSRLNGS